MPPTGRQQDRSLRLAVCEKTPEAQEELAASLRTAGVVSRISSFKTKDELVRIVSGAGVDVVVWGESATQCPLEDVLQAASSSQAPVVVAMDTLSDESFSKIRLMGVADVYLRGDRSLMAHVVAAQAAVSTMGKHAEQVQAAIVETDRRCDALLEAMADPVAYLGEGLHIKANNAYLEMLGFSSFEDLEGMSLLDFVSPQDANEVREKIKRLGRSQGMSEEMDMTLSTGTLAHAVFSSANYEGEPCLQVAFRRDSSAAPVALLPTSTPAGAAVPGPPPPSMEEWLKRDPASGLFNRSYFLTRILRPAPGYSWTVQLDRHEEIVVAVGPTQLDALMSSLGKLLETALPEGACVARWTASQVAVLCPDLDLPTMAMVRERVGREFIEAAGKSFPASIAAGGVVINDTLNADQIVLCMDKALREAREDTDRIRLIDPMGSVKEQAKEVADRVAAIRKAIAEDQLLLVFQPIVSLVGGPECYEVLARMRDESGKVLEPYEFMPFATENGLAGGIDEWVIHHAIQQMAQRQMMGKKTNLLVKTSLDSIKDASFVQRVREWMTEASVAPEQVWVEIAMSVASSNAKEARRFRDELSGMGTPIVLSGFPMDATAFRMTEVISPAWIKLSREFVVDLGHSQEKQSALASVVEQAAASGAKVLVGFVEDAMLLTSLFSLGVDAAQGNFLSPPLPKMSYDFSQFGG